MLKTGCKTPSHYTQHYRRHNHIRKNENNNGESALDKKRILLTNVPNNLYKNHLKSYLNYLSDGVEVERLDLSTELRRSIVVTFAENINLKSIMNNYETRHHLLSSKLEIHPVYHPDTIIVELEERNITNSENRSESKDYLDQFMRKPCKRLIKNAFSKELLEKYFSNKKRFGVKLGENPVDVVVFDEKKNLYYVKFHSFQTAKLISQQKNLHIHHKPVKIRLYYKNIGPDPFQSNLHNIFTAQSLNQLTNKTSSTGIDSTDNSNETQDNLNESIVSIKPAILDHLRNTITNKKLSVISVVQSKVHNGKPLVNLPTLNDPLLQLTHQEYAHLKGIEKEICSKDDVYKKTEDEKLQEFYVNTQMFKNKFSSKFPVSSDSEHRTNILLRKITSTNQATSTPKRSPIVIPIHNTSTHRPPPPKIINTDNKPTFLNRSRLSLTRKQQNLYENDTMLRVNIIRKNSILANYGNTTEAQSIKLDVNDILFFKYTTYITQLKDIFNRISINLNESLKHLYLFGDKKQVKEAKQRIESDLKSFLLFEYKIERPELAEFILKPEIDKRIFNYLNILLAGKEYTYTKNNEETNLGSNPTSNNSPIKFNFCSYNVKKLKPNNANPTNYVEIYTNSKDNAEFFKKFLMEAIAINFEFEIETDIASLIESNNKKWADFFKLKYEHILDCRLEQKSYSNFELFNNNFFGQNKHWYFRHVLKITGFKQDISNFIFDLNSKFIYNNNL